LAVGQICQVSQAVVNTPVVSNMVNMRSMMALSVSGSLPATDALDFPEVLPQDFNRVFQGPNGGNASTVAFKFGPCDGP